MRIYIFLLGIFLSFIIYGNSLRPCQFVGYERVAEYAILTDGAMDLAGISIQDREEEILLLKKCIEKYSVCIIEAASRDVNWLSKKLVRPIDKNFDPVSQSLVFGVLQYVDKKSGLSICIAATNSFAHAVPWIGESWVIDGNLIKEYQLDGGFFNTVMTPSKLYKALLASHQDAVKYNQVVKTIGLDHRFENKR